MSAKLQTRVRRIAPPPHAALATLPLYWNYRHGIKLIESWIRSKSAGQPLRILEAGCGNKWPLNLDGVPYTLTAVDVDEDALELRRGRLRPDDRIMAGDLRTRHLVPDGRFDVIYSSFVLEHVQGAEQVLRNFVAWLAPGGLMILRVPDRDSVYGFCTRATPLWLHVLYKKYVQGMKNAGKPGYDPYPTFYDEVVSRRGIRRFCEQHGCALIEEVGNADYLPRVKFRAALTRAAVKLVSALSFGRLAWRHNNLTFIIEKSRR